MVDVTEAKYINKQLLHTKQDFAPLRLRMPDLASFTFQAEFFCDVVKV